jgi:acyl carrier protein
MTDVTNEILKWIKENSSKGELWSEEIRPDTDLIENDLLDSIDLLKLVSHLEDYYGFSMHPDELTPESFVNANAISDLVRRNLP